MRVNFKVMLTYVVIVMAICIPILCSYLQPVSQDILKTFTVQEKLQPDYVLSKYSGYTRYNIIVIDTDGNRSIESIDLLTYHDTKVGDQITLNYGKPAMRAMDDWGFRAFLTEVGFFVIIFFGFLAVEIRNEK